MTAPARLREDLEQLRDRGLTFKTAWPIAMSYALRDRPLRDQLFWRETWREQRVVWEISFSRVAWPAKDRQPVLHRSLGEEEPSARTLAQLVA